MRNKYRLSIMIVLIIMLFMYIAGVVGVAYETRPFQVLCKFKKLT